MKMLEIYEDNWDEREMIEKLILTLALYVDLIIKEASLT